MHNSDGMIKLIFSDSFDPAVETGARLMNSDSKLVKQASTIFGCDYSDLTPDKDHVGIHLVAMGDFEHFGSNRNADGWPKKACADYHNTFVTCGHLYQGHNNKDPKKARGIIKSSAYNGNMGRIELFIHAHKKKAEEDITRLEKEGSIPVSMAARVPHDRCLICNTLRKSAHDPNQCDHVRSHLGDTFEDGKVACVLNDQPTFFDISFVRRPADRIAWDLKKIASDSIISSIELAEQYNVQLPESLIDLGSATMAKIAIAKQLAEFEEMYTSLTKKASLSSTDKYFLELRKAVLTKIADSTIKELREFEPAGTFNLLASKGIVLAPDTFFKYAFGLDYGELADSKEAILSAIRNNVFTNLIKQGEHTKICSNNYFDVDTLNTNRYSMDIIKLGNFISNNLIRPLSLLDVDRRIIDNTISRTELPIKTASNEDISGKAKAAASVYAAYKVAALKGILDINKDSNKNAVIAMAAYQDLT